MMRRIYKSGSRWALWRWAESPLLYMKRLMILHTPVGGVMLNFISRPDPHPDLHDHPVDFWSFILRGWYWERRYGPNLLQTTNRYVSRFSGEREKQWGNGKQRYVNRMKASPSIAHTIFKCRPNTITLVFYGQRLREWGYHTPRGWVHWKQYNKVA